jgi:hypothetical protein
MRRIKLKINIKSESTPLNSIEVSDSFLVKAIDESRWQHGETKLGQSYKAKFRKARRRKVLGSFKYEVENIEGNPVLEQFLPTEYMDWRD